MKENVDIFAYAEQNKKNLRDSGLKVSTWIFIHVQAPIDKSTEVKKILFF